MIFTTFREVQSDLNDYLANLGQVVWDHGDEIIAALEARQNKKESHVVNHLS